MPLEAPTAGQAAAEKKPSKWKVEMPASVLQHRTIEAARTRCCSQCPSFCTRSEVDWKDAYPVHCAAQLGDCTALSIALAATQASASSLNAPDDDGWAPLHYAAWYGHTAAVQLLLDRGANVNVVNQQNATALHFAAGAGRLETVQLLLQRGADRTVKNAEKQTPLQLLLELKPDHWQELQGLLQ